ncbi:MULTISPECIES: hypothetical protein [Rhizobium]|uniref:hypothetical protein n=1 Tax=Rhizobium TaxID=379 RepID=UPI001106C6D0|nr:MULTISPECIES: hypothetical protein [Rhizobium]MBY3594529.1 hypothetical protein [Rhizobium bangladeshense]TLX13881.1 hypothetical protein FFR93_08735 [Rhizobium sp. MHM7A]
MEKNTYLSVHEFDERQRSGWDGLICELFGSDPDLAMLLDNVAAILSEHAAVLADDIADPEGDCA